MIPVSMALWLMNRQRAIRLPDVKPEQKPPPKKPRRVRKGRRK